MIIRGPSTADYDIDLGALPLTDWFHATTFTANAAAVHANGPPTADNVLVNGTMTSPVGGAYAETVLTPGKAHLLRLMNVGINNYFHVGLDGHEFQVISADFTPIEPFFTDTLSIGVGKFPAESFSYLYVNPLEFSQHAPCATHMPPIRQRHHPIHDNNPLQAPCN